jgi:hypothetical protein
MSQATISTAVGLPAQIASARQKLDAHTREIVNWHFSPETGCPFWLDYAAKLGLGSAQGNKLLCRARQVPAIPGRVASWRPGTAMGSAGLAGQPTYVFETGGSTGVPKSRVQMNDFRIDYENFSGHSPRRILPKGADWISVGPSGPRRLRLAVEHLAQHRGGICFTVRPRSALVIKLIKWGDGSDGRALQAARRGSVAHHFEGAREHQMHVHHP